MQAFYLPLFLKAEKKSLLLHVFLVIQQLLFMLILAYLQIDLCLFCAMPAVNKDIWRIISICRRKALLALPIALFFFFFPLHFRPKGCSTGKLSNGKLRDELNLKCPMVPQESINYFEHMHGALWTPTVSVVILNLYSQTHCSPNHC